MTKERIFVVSTVIGDEVDQPPKPNYERFTDEEILLGPGFPKLAFIEDRYNNDPTNWWIPNYSALPAMMRSAGLRVVGRPHSHVLIGEPEQHHGKVTVGSLVFPRYGKRGAALHPGQKMVDASLWSDLEKRASEFRMCQKRLQASGAAGQQRGE